MKRTPRARMGLWLLALAAVLLRPAIGNSQEAAPAKSSPAAVQQYADAVAFQNRGVYDLAADEWEKFLKNHAKDPLAPKAQYYLGVCSLQLKKYDEAIAAFNKVIENYPKFDLLDQAYLNLGLAQYSVGQTGKAEAYDKAAESLGALAQKFPESKYAAQAQYYRGESLYARGKKAEAAAAYGDVVEKHPKSPQRAEALYALGVTQDELGKPDLAGAMYDLFLKEFPKHEQYAEVVMRRAETLYAGGKFADAEKWFASAAASKDFALADYATVRQAASLFEQKKYPEAAALYASVVTKFPKSTYLGTAALNAGNCYYLAGNLDEAQKWLSQATSGESGPEASHWLARVLLKKGKPSEALAVVEKSLPAAGKSPFAVNLLMDQADAVYEIDGRRGDAAKLYAALAAKHADSPLAAQALYMAAFSALGQGDFAGAASQAEAFLKSHAGDALVPDVKFVAAEAYLQINKLAEAEKIYSELLEKSPQHSDAEQWKVRRALVLLLGKKYDAVAKNLEPLVPTLKKPDAVAEAQYLLGTAQLELQHFDQAAKALAASIAASPKWRQADETLLNLAAAYRGQSKLPEAAATVRKVIADFPNSKVLDRAHYRLGEYLYAAGDYKGATAEYQNVLKNWSTGPLAAHALYGLAWAQLSEKDYSAAATTATSLLEKYPDNALAARARYARAMCRQQLKEFPGAVEDIDAFLKSDPAAGEKSDARYVKGLCLVGLKKFDEAIGVFQSIESDDTKYAHSDKVLYELAWAYKSQNKDKQAGEAFARLAEKFADSPLAAESLYHVGEAAYATKDYSVAADSYFAAMNKAGKTDLGEKAAHKLSWAYYQQGQYEKAQKSFDYQLATYPQGELAGDAQFLSAETSFKQNKYEVALAAYQKLLAKPLANKDFQVLAYLHAGQSAGQLKKWPESLKVLQQAAKEFPDSSYGPELLYEQGWAQQNLGKIEEAFKLYEQVTTQTQREAGARARFMMGEILFEKKDYKEAVRNFFKVAYGYGYPQSSEAIKTWQANAAYEAGRCFEVLKMTEKAKESYKEVVDKYPKSDKATLAKTRITALGT